MRGCMIENSKDLETRVEITYRTDYEEGNYEGIDQQVLLVIYVR